jgi:hypothetical protein
LAIARDLSGPMQEGFRFFRDAPATKRFLKFHAYGRALGTDLAAPAAANSALLPEEPVYGGQNIFEHMT